MVRIPSGLRLRPIRILSFTGPLLAYTILVVLVCLCTTNFHFFFNDRTVEASRLRDKEELRYARALSQLNAWKHLDGFRPFTYESMISTKKFAYHHLSPAPGITFAILMPNRVEYRIDSYEPSYMIDSFVSLISAVLHDTSLYAARFRFINITLCPTTDHLTNLTDLIHLHPFITKNALKRRPHTMGHLSLACRTVFDVANCLEQSAPSFFNGNFLVILEDDMALKKTALNQLWKIITHFYSHQNNLSLNWFPQLVQLHTPSTAFTYSFELLSLFELLFISFFITALAFTCGLKIWCRPFLFWYNFTFFVCTMLINMLIVFSVGRAYWWLFYHQLFDYQSIRKSFDPLAPSTGASLLLPAHVARNIGQFLNTFSCDEIESIHASKSQLIYRYAFTHNLGLWWTYPNLMKHRGLYSIYKHDTLDPVYVE